MAIFVKPVHQSTYKKLLAKHKVTPTGKSFEETLIKLLESMDDEIENAQKDARAAKNKKTLNFLIMPQHWKP